MQHVLFTLDQPARTDVGKGEENGFTALIGIDDLAGIQQHGPVSDARKIMLDLKAVHRRLSGNDGFEQCAQGGDVPLPVAEQIQQAPARLRLVDLESLVERAARCHNVKAFVQHQERIVNGVDDCLGKRLRVFDPAKIKHGREFSDQETKVLLAPPGSYPIRPYRG